MLRIRNCDAGYGKLRVLKGVSLHVAPGEIVAIIGPNGAGKTTLLHTVTGVIPARSGEILLQGRSIRDVTPERVVSLGCTLVPEGRQVFSTMTVRENLVLGSYLRLKGGGVFGSLRVAASGKQAKPSGQKQAHAASGKQANHPGQKREEPSAQGDGPPGGAISMEMVFELFPVLEQREHQLAGTLSGGEQQMLAIGRALMTGPRLLLMDEPSMGIAPLVVRSIFQTVRKLRDQGMTILLVEQNARASLAVADRGYVLETGQVVLEGTARELLDNGDVQRAYLGKEYSRIDE
jgi:branched-chain amino acid transport system ATP-binding protein